MAILGPDGEVLELGGEKPRLEVAAGASLKLAFPDGGGRIETDESILEFAAGAWMVVPLHVWQRTAQLAMERASGNQAIGLPNRAQRRAQARQDRRN